jgi:hypothetical protein
MNDAIPCSLSPEDYRRRMSAVRKLGEVALVDVETMPDGALLSFRNSKGVRDLLASMVQAYAACCPFLGLALGSDEEERLTLAISAAPAGLAVARDLAARFQGASSL